MSRFEVRTDTRKQHRDVPLFLIIFRIGFFVFIFQRASTAIISITKTNLKSQFMQITGAAQKTFLWLCGSLLAPIQTQGVKIKGKF